jgi:hypothetical protein
MILLKADKNTEAGIPPSMEVIAAMMKYDEELCCLPARAYSRARRGRASNSPLANAPSSTVGPFPELRTDRVPDVPGELERRGDRMCQALPDLVRGGEYEIEIRRVFEASDLMHTPPAPAAR